MHDPDTQEQRRAWRWRLARMAGLRRPAPGPPSTAPVPACDIPLPGQKVLHRFLRPQDLRQYRSLLFAARLIVEGCFAGRHRSPHHDFSAEFADYRPYVPGDEVRAVDWRAVARTDRLFVKLFRKETDMSACLVVDQSASMGFSGAAEITKFEYCAYLAAAIAFLMLQQGDRPGLALRGSSLQGFRPPGGTLRHLHALLADLERASPAGSTDLAGSLRAIFPLLRRRGLLVVLSDLLEAPEDLFHALAMYTHRGFAVLLLQVLSEEELRLPQSGAARFVDPEGPGALHVDPGSIRDAYQRELARHLAALREGARARGIHYQLVSTATPLSQALGDYLTSRGR